MGTLSCYPYPFLLPLPFSATITRESVCGFYPSMDLLLLCQFDINLNGLVQNTKLSGGGHRKLLGFPHFGGTWRTILRTVLTHQC